MPAWGPVIDVFFNLGGEHRRRVWQRPQGAHHQCLLHPRWWPLPDPPVAPVRGAAIDVFFILGGGYCRTHRQRPQGGRHRRLFQPRWWPLSDPPQRPPGGPPSTSSSISVLAVAGPAGSHPLSTSSSTSVVATTEPTDSAPQEACHRRLLQPRWWPLPDPSTAPPMGPVIDVLQQELAVASIYCQHLPGGHCGKLSLLGMLQARHFMRIFLDP
jgi:hypothetical protein